MTKEPLSLVAIVTRRIIFYAALAMLGQLVAVVVQTWSDDLQLGHMAIEHESFALAQGLTPDLNSDRGSGACKPLILRVWSRIFSKM